MALQAEGLVFESQLRYTLVVKTGSDSSTAKCSVIGVSVTVLVDDHYKRMPRVTVEYSLLNGHECHLQPFADYGDVSIRV